MTPVQDRNENISYVNADWVGLASLSHIRKGILGMGMVLISTGTSSFNLQQITVSEIFNHNRTRVNFLKNKYYSNY
jgi:hypothetical protein